jgi:hypothetical protein
MRTFASPCTRSTACTVTWRVHGARVMPVGAPGRIRTCDTRFRRMRSQPAGAGRRPAQIVGRQHGSAHPWVRPGNGAVTGGPGRRPPVAAQYRPWAATGGGNACGPVTHVSPGQRWLCDRDLATVTPAVTSVSAGPRGCGDRVTKFCKRHLGQAGTRVSVGLSGRQRGHERLDDLAELAPTRLGRLVGCAGGLRQVDNLNVEPALPESLLELPRGRVHVRASSRGPRTPQPPARRASWPPRHSP